MTKYNTIRYCICIEYIIISKDTLNDSGLQNNVIHIDKTDDYITAPSDVKSPEIPPGDIFFIMFIMAPIYVLHDRNCFQ